MNREELFRNTLKNIIEEESKHWKETKIPEGLWEMWEDILSDWDLNIRIRGISDRIGYYKHEMNCHLSEFAEGQSNKEELEKELGAENLHYEQFVSAIKIRAYRFFLDYIFGHYNVGVKPTEKNEPGEIDEEFRGNKFYKSISEQIRLVDKKVGWKYAFRSEKDYAIFIRFLSEYFESGIVPEKIFQGSIRLQKNSKTRLAPIFRELHHEHTGPEVSLRSDIGFFSVLRTLDLFYIDPDIYKTLSR